MQKNVPLFFLSLLFLLLLRGSAVVAADGSDLFITNSLNEEIVFRRVLYATPGGEPRYMGDASVIQPGAETRIGVQGTTHPQSIWIDLATKTYAFEDLSPLNPDSLMRLEVKHENGVPLLRRQSTSGGAPLTIKGEERNYLTTANKPNAMDRDELTSATTWNEVMELLGETVKEAREQQGEAREFSLEAGPIKNHDHALTRCAEVVEEWNRANGKKARWNGNWRTTVPSKMSVCDCVEGTAKQAETVFLENAGGGRVAFFPVEWKGRYGVARILDFTQDAPEDGLVVALRFRHADDAAPLEMLTDFMDDLRVDGFRPWMFTLSKKDKENDAVQENSVSFRDGDTSKYDDQDRLQEEIFAAYRAAKLDEATSLWVSENTFDTVRAGGETPLEKCVLLRFSPGTFEAFFLPDVRPMIY